MKIGRKILIWIFVIVTSICMLILGYVYAYTIFPVDMLRLGMERLSSVAQESYSAAKSFSLNSFIKVVLLIFMNNALANMLFALPFLGIVLYAYIITFTGAVLRFYIDFLETNIKIIFNGKVILLLLITPHTYIEFLAYAITLTESTLFSVNIVRGMITKKSVIGYLLMLGLSYVVLFIAALVEALAIFIASP